MSAAEMTPDRWKKIQDVFDRALGLDPRERSLFLEKATADDPDLRREVVSLVRSLQEASRFIEDPAIDALTTEAFPGHPSDGRDRFEPGSRVGAYRLEGLIGAGGAGQVFLAVRDDQTYEQRVAIKVIKRGMDTDDLVRRFRGERQILARLEHPNVAKLLDGGATSDGRPYLVMEYVDGLPIDRWCEEQELDLDDRIRLFLSVCDAVRFAHRNLIVHRDLKPGNILVSKDGAAKLLDFGIAKLLDPETFPGTILPTAPGWRAMTPEYASPEQVRGEVVNTGSDVYSLGVVLYELLVGQRPYEIAERSVAGIERAIVEQEAPTASRRVRELDPEDRRARQLVGDLDDILAMALEKEPDRRYASVGQLEEDLRSYLGGLPISARKSSAFYRTSKFVRRHRWGVTAAALVFLISISFSIALWLQRADILRQRDRAEQVSAFLVELFTVSDPSRERGETVTAREILDKGARDAESRLRDRPGLLGDLLGTMGTTYTRLGLYAEAEPLLERSLELRRRAHGPRDPSVATAIQQLAELDRANDRLETAEERVRRALELRLDHFGEGHEQVVESRLELARIRELRGDPKEAGRLYALAVAGARELDTDDLLIRSLSAYGVFAHHADQRQLGRRLLDESLALGEAFWGENHPEVAAILNRRALVESQAQPELARSLLGRALRIHGTIYRNPHPDTVPVLHTLGFVYQGQGHLDQAEQHYRRVLDLQRSLYSRPTHLEAMALDSLAGVLMDQGHVAEAEELYRRSLDLHRDLLGEGHEDTANVLNNLGHLLQSTERPDEAERVLKEALDILVAVYGEEHSRVAITRSNLGQIAQERGDFESARRIFEQAAASLEAVSATHEVLPIALQNLASLERQAGDPQRAMEIYQRALDVLDANGTIDGPTAGTIYTNLLVAQVGAGELEAAERSGRRALAIYSRLEEEGSPNRLRSRRRLAIVHQRQGRHDEAVQLAEENLATCRRTADEASCAPHLETLERLVAKRDDSSDQ